MLSSLLALLALLGPAPQAQDDAARLIPPGAGVIVRLESVQSWNAFVRGFAPLADEDEEMQHYDLQTVLDEMAADEDVAEVDRPLYVAQAERPKLDPALPLYLAFTLDPNAGPSVTFVAPVTNDAPFHFHSTFASGKEQNVHLGRYAGVSTVSGYAAAPAPNPLVAGLRPGVASVHVDVAQLVAAFRPLIESGLQQAEGMLDQLPEQESGLDMTPLMEQYLALARSLMDSAQTLDLALERQKDELALRFDYVERTERMPAPKVADLTPLLGRIDSASALQFAYNGSWSDALALMGDFLDSALEMYPEPLRTEFAHMLTLQEEIAARLEPGFAGGVDFTTAGVHGAYVLRAQKPAEVIEQLERGLHGLDTPEGLLSVGKTERVVDEGVVSLVLPLQVRYEVLGSTLEKMSGEDPDAAEVRKELEKTLAKLYGHDLRIALASQGEFVLVALANDDAELRADMSLLRRPSAPSPRMLGLLDRLEPGALGLAYRFDLGQTMGQMFDVMSEMMGNVAFPNVEAAFDVWGSLRGSHWSGGLALRVDELIRLVRAMEDMEPK